MKTNMNMKLAEHIKRLLPCLDESQRRKFLASEAMSLGRGGIAEVSRISGVHRNTIRAGIKELNNVEGEAKKSTGTREG